jgi:hypothetical protein
MPTIGGVLAGSIIAAGPPLKGPTWFKVAAATGGGIATWLKLGPAATLWVGSVNGTLGGGTVNGKIFVAPLVPGMVGAFAGVGMVGPTAAKVASAIAVGLANNLNATGTYKGASVGVGVGADVGKVVFANPATLFPVLVGSFAGKGLIGPSAIRMATAITIGTCSILMTGSGGGAVTGPTGPLPGTGGSVCSIL